MKLIGIVVLVSVILEINSQCIDELILGAANDTNAFDLVSSESSREVRIEGDIKMKLEDYVEMMKEKMEEKQGKRKKRKAARDTRRRWPNAIVPYEIASGTFSGTEQSQINAAISDWNAQTCLVFRPSRGEAARIRFQNGDGCSSFVGRVGNAQPVSLARGCRIKRIIIHEMGHAIGFQHEQSRPDRDGFVRIIEANIPQPVLFNFESLPSSQVNNFDVPYDYRSVMHYGARAFSTNGGITVQTLDSRFQDIIGTAPGLSFRDIKLANIMYNCNANCQTKLNCPGEGFQAKDCSCKCPSNDPNNPIQNCQGTQASTTTPNPAATTTRNPVTATTPRVGCRDQHRYCRYWAYTGECNSRRGSGFMRLYCRNACGLCNVESSCRDFGRSCAFWARMGYCRMTFVTYMSRNCRQTCGFCGQGGGSDNNSDQGNNQGQNNQSGGNAQILSSLPVTIAAFIICLAQKLY